MIKRNDYGPYLKPGTAVRYDGGDDGRSEYGIVVHCWINEEVHAHDCYVAFFGDQLPTEKPGKLPYVLRYFSTALTVLSPTAGHGDTTVLPS
jgi:hypothetical protein